MYDLDECRDVEHSDDALANSHDFAQLAAVVFEWHLAQTRDTASPREPAPANERWMSRLAHRTDATS